MAPMSTSARGRARLIDRQIAWAVGANADACVQPWRARSINRSIAATKLSHLTAARSSGQCDTLRCLAKRDAGRCDVPSRPWQSTQVRPGSGPTCKPIRIPALRDLEAHRADHRRLASERPPSARASTYATHVQGSAMAELAHQDHFRWGDLIMVMVMCA